jgi:hypothetical protein
VHERQGRDRHTRGFGLGALGQLRALGGEGGGDRLGALRGLRVSVLARVATNRFRQLGQGGLRLAEDRDLGRIVLAELPRVHVEMDDREPRRHRIDVVG